MKLAMTLLCKNEADIIQQWMTFHRPLVDLMIVTDNGSTDGTLEYLRSLPNIILMEEPGKTYFQSKWVLRMIQLAREKEAEWCINSDADEFWVGDLRAEITQAQATGNTLIFVPAIEHRCTTIGLIDPIQTMLYRDKEQKKVEGTPEVAHRKIIHSLEKPILEIYQGNHGLRFVDTKFYHPITSESLCIHHFSVRSFAHYLRKMKQGAAAYAAHPNKILGTHWRRAGEILAKSGLPGLQECFAKEQFFNEKELEKDETLAKLKLPMLPVPENVSTITTVYAPTNRIRDITLLSLKATRAEFPYGHSIAAVDLATPGFVASAEALDYAVVHLTDGELPRMSRLLERALCDIHTSYTVTVECDVIPDPGSGMRLVTALACSPPNVAGVEALYHDLRMRPNFPATYNADRRTRWKNGLAKDDRHLCLGMTAWRTEALKSIDWSQVRSLDWCDLDMCDQMSKKGWIFLAAKDIGALHLVSQSRLAANQIGGRK